MIHDRYASASQGGKPSDNVTSPAVSPKGEYYRVD
jgi:hypothetical protein